MKYLLMGFLLQSNRIFDSSNPRRSLRVACEQNEFEKYIFTKKKE